MNTRPSSDDLTCPICSKPVRSAAFEMSEHGELIHTRCRSRQLQLPALAAVDRAQVARARVGERVTESGQGWRRQRTQTRRQALRQQSCPLCHGAAMLLDWRPALEWMTVEGCLCHGFFAWTRLVDSDRLARLTLEDRRTLSQLIRAVSAIGEVWLSTLDGTVMGALNIGDECPERPTSPPVSCETAEDPTCPVCSKPVASQGFTQVADGQVFHLGCRARHLHLRTLERIDRSQIAQQRATQLLETCATRDTSASRRIELQQPRCPLCGFPAVLTDWPQTKWIVVEHCPCHGFSIWRPILERVRALPARDRHDLAHRVRAFRVLDDAWIATTDGRVTGPLVVRTKRPDRAPDR